MTPQDIEKALKQINNHENELRELKKDIHALATVEVYHALGVMVPLDKPQPTTPAQLEEYNSAMDRLNSRYGRQRRG